MTDVLHDSETIMALDFEPEIGCEGESHPKMLHGHSETPVNTLVIFPCGENKYMCDGWVVDCANYDLVVCACESEHPVSRLSFIPIAAT